MDFKIGDCIVKDPNDSIRYRKVHITKMEDDVIYGIQKINLHLYAPTFQKDGLTFVRIGYNPLNELSLFVAYATIRDSGNWKLG